MQYREFCEACGRMLAHGEITLCGQCFRDEFKNIDTVLPADPLDDDDDEELEHELQGSL